MANGLKRVLGGVQFLQPPVFAPATVAALGSNQSGAALLTGTVNHVTGADGTKGVRLPAVVRPGVLVVVYNAHTTSALKVYPPSSGTINGGSANAAIDLAARTPAVLIATSATNWAKL